VLVLGNRPDLTPLAKKFKLPFARISWADRARAEARALRRSKRTKLISWCSRGL